MIKISCEYLQKLGACEDGINWFINQRKRRLRPLVYALLADDHAGYAEWLISRLMTYPQRINWAIFSAEQTIKLFEDKYPTDDRPRKAIQAARDVLAGITASNAAETARAAAGASTVAAARAAETAGAAARAAAWAAAWAAETARADAGASTVAAARAADAAWAAAEAAEAAGAAMNKTIMEYGLNLLGE